MSVVPHTRSPEAIATPVPLEGRHRWTALLPEVAQLAHAIANTDFVPKAMRNNEAAIVAAIMYGDEVGLAPMQSLAKIAVIDGKPSLAAEAQRALILAAGHYIWFEELTTTKATWAGRRADLDQISRVTWTMDDARKANLAGKPNWRSYPRAMLSARASAELARAMFADVIGGLAATEELEDVVEGTAEPEPEAPRKASSRRRRPTRATAPVVAPVPPSGPEEPPMPALPEEETEPSASKASDAQLRKIFALCNEHGLTDRDDRLDWTNEQLDRTVVSASELTDVEASKLIDALEAMAPVAAEAAAAGEAAGEATLQGAEELIAEAQLALAGDELVSDERVGILWWMRTEAGVEDDWLRAKLAELGVTEIPKRITRTLLKRLTKQQGEQLAGALNAQIDARNEE